MRQFKMISLTTIIVLGTILWLKPGVQSSQANLESADSLFKAGKFAEAEELYTKALTSDPKNVQALIRLGYIALLSNRLNEAQEKLSQAVELKPEDSAPKSLLAETFYRRDDFLQAAPLLRAVGKEAKAKQLESFKEARPYQIESMVGVTSLKFVLTDPLPVIQVQVNGTAPVNFFIDTGGAEVIIDTEFAKEVGAAQFGTETGTFAGGKQADFEFGRVDSLRLGDFLIKNVPVHVIGVRRFSQPVFGGRRVDGIIGTVLLYHFISTLDYPRGELILRRKTSENSERFEKDAREQESNFVPFWMAGDHYMVAWGTANKSQPMLFFVDTGLAGGGFTCPESTLKEGGIRLQETQAGEGIGGGGRVKVVPFVVEELTLGKVREQNVRGIFSGAFPLENAFEFRIGGIISHGFFRPYALTFDFKSMRLVLKKSASKKIPGNGSQNEAAAALPGSQANLPFYSAWPVFLDSGGTAGFVSG
jgi:hypothetical protein